MSASRKVILFSFSTSTVNLMVVSMEDEIENAVSCQ